MKPIRHAVLLGMLLGTDFVRAQESPDLETAHQELYRKAAPAIVGVQGPRTFQGSGVIVSADGWVLTSTLCTGPDAQTVKIVLADGRTAAGRVERRDPALEVAVVRIEADGPFPFLPLGDSTAVEIGEVACTLGDSFRSLFNDGQVSISAGVVSGAYSIAEPRGRSTVVGPVLETTAAVNPGNEGGPLVDSRGRVLGMVTAAITPATWAGLAIPIDRLKPALRLAGALPWPPSARGSIAMTVENDAAGARVAAVRPGGAAEAAGARPGDVVLAVDGLPAPDADAFARLLDGRAAGEPVLLRVRRGDEELDLRAVLGRRPL